MAITYKSQGSGVSTETSAAALSPLCPATVDAGDILIAHVFWEGTTTAPSTPSGWSLLSGPHVIETTIARHWLFGKIAAGNEDGAAVAFGNPAVTTQRAARIYSFAGRTGGLITELVTGFSHQSHATDPAMPTVITTIAGALAVALVAQNDNNAFISPTGETGGDWVEAVAEYTAALTPGFSLGIETATPTGDPGTITGGTMATTNDPCGVIGFQIKQSNNQNISAGLGAVSYAGLAPLIQTPRNVSADVGALSFAGLSPSIQINVTVNAGVGAIAYSGLTPSVVATQNVNLSAGTGTVTYEGLTPTIQTPRNILVGLGACVYAGFEPLIQTPRNVSVGLGVITLSGLAPNIETPREINAGLGIIVNSGFAPVVTTPVNVSSGLGQFVFTGFTPSVSTGDAQEVLPGIGSVTYAGFQPIVATPINIQSGVGQSVYTGLSPIIVLPKNAQVGLGSINFTGYNPTVSVASAGDIEIFAGVGGLVFIGFSPNALCSTSRERISLRPVHICMPTINKEPVITVMKQINKLEPHIVDPSIEVIDPNIIL